MVLVCVGGTREIYLVDETVYFKCIRTSSLYKLCELRRDPIQSHLPSSLQDQGVFKKQPIKYDRFNIRLSRCTDGWF